MSQYSSLSRAQLSFDYLHTNSTTHEFLFGALAELLDNARDAKATKINIYTVPDKNLRGGNMLCFLDDGNGMAPDEAADIITFGKSAKRSTESSMIGMYGNGLKSGSMRIGNDLIVFSKKGQLMTCVFLSRSFHEQEDIDEIIVPMPVFDSTNKKPLAKSAADKQKHNLEMQLILKYSPFRTEAAFFREFDKIDGNNGTLVTVYNLKLLDTTEPELDVKTDPYDILLTNPDGGDFDSDEGDGRISHRLMPERRSFRAYASVLYVDPRMRIYIHGKKVQTKRLVSNLYKPRVYKYASGRFKARSENEVKKAKEEAAISENKAKEAESKARNLESKIGTGGSREQRAELRRIQASSAELRKDAQIKKQMAERKNRSLKDPKALNFVFGMNLDSRSQDGMFVYNCSRLIKMYQKVGPQADGGVFCSGVVGIVDVPYLVLEPTHNKQDFADAKEYRHLQKAMGEHMVQYWKDVGIAQQGVTKFWETFGYISPNWRDPPSQDPKFQRKRAMQVSHMLQCDLCLKWRILPFSSNNIGKAFPDDWVCSMNPDPSHNRCSAAEQKLNIPEGILKKETKSREQKEKDLEEEIRKKQEQLNKMMKVKPVYTSRQAKQEETEESEEESEEEVVRPNRGRQATKRPVAKLKPPPKPAPSSTPKRSSRVVQPESEESEEELIEEPPANKRRRSHTKPREPTPPKPQPKVTPSMRQTASSKRRATTTETEESEDEKPTRPAKTPARQTPRSSQNSRSNSSRNKSAKSEDEDIKTESEAEVEKIEADEGPALVSEVSDADIGCKVEVRQQNKWVQGVIVEIAKITGKWRIKFDRYPLDKNDKWFESNSTLVRKLKNSLLQSAAAQSTVNNAANNDSQAETPSSSTPGAATSQSLHDEIANGYRTCLRYFLPPNWIMDKESVSTLTVQELSTFNLDDFFDHYEKGLRKLVSSFQLEAQTRRGECEQVTTKLQTVRKMIAKLLKSINEEFDIDPECDTDQVDELLALCVKQAVAQEGEN